MDANQNSSSNVKLRIVFGLFIGLIAGLIVYEVRQHIIAMDQRENYEAVRKKQSEDLKEVYQENLEQKKAKDQEEVKKDTTNSDSL
ncbi:hypothetical protein N8085_06155 [Salibacteraceae bacterium]|jgi:hypothetical protein|nr:hypothetical protein [Salibacteraceae bacterium]MDB0058109.1 hypothetical protein [Salibacteraceae bacterium]MDC1204959.1 hypothetical protein [Salibacteraceae bacterium]|tara:strand:- start:371 stop:628 length:258 start_codon:yes stop_codon:yes gene_type:complete